MQRVSLVSAVKVFRAFLFLLFPTFEPIVTSFVHGGSTGEEGATAA